ncbi:MULTISPECIES: large conductance mechanosensitive channel protein MscL [unclassified Paenibacillus]|uniref:large conductance mechanosensitive channel protein MscL n=1 Tax=unclassified Paenibacillus TaxID=185978 RepID=UPI000931592B|nr:MULTISPECIES: large conductance mechanosensitive channel protein MscL [unclassified Paenibacillus]
MWKEFKEFSMKGNMVDLAIGVIIGGAFGKVVTSIVNDIIMPPIGLILGKVPFKDLFLSLDGKHYNTINEAKEAGVATLNYGQFISTLIDFLIVAFVIFVVVKQLNRLRKKEEAKPAPKPEVKECPECLSEIPLKATRCKYCTAPVGTKAGGLS